MWLAFDAGTPPKARLAARLPYGQAPKGLRDRVAPQPLTPGCYYASVLADPGRGGLTFWVTADGRIRESTAAERDSIRTISSRRVAAQIRDADSAIARCKDQYAIAQTVQDSATVDRAVWTDTVRFGSYSCAWFRRYYRSQFQGKP